VSDGLKDIAIATLKAVANDGSAPAAARAAAARTLLEMLGEIGRLQVPQSGSETALVEMTASEIDAEISRLRTLAGGGRKGSRYRLL
jgi:hypothetical protein